MDHVALIEKGQSKLWRRRRTTRMTPPRRDTWVLLKSPRTPWKDRKHHDGESILRHSNGSQVVRIGSNQKKLYVGTFGI